jgi:hypothetical protein
MNWHTTHVFGYGETQVLTEFDDKKAPNDELKKLPAYIKALWEKRPKDFPEDGLDFHAITAFKNDLYEWTAKNRKSFRIYWSELDPIFVEELVEEVSQYEPPISE